MRNIFSRLVGGLAVGLFALGLSFTPALAKTANPTPAPLSAELDSLDDGPHFFSGRMLTLDQMYTGTVYAGAGQLKFTGAVDGDLVVFGGSIEIDGSVLGDVYVAGGTVVLNGDVGGNLTAAAGEVRIGPEGEVSGAVVGGSGVYRQEGTVLGDVQIGAKEAILTGTVGQNARFETEKLTIGDSAAIGENLQADVRRTSTVSEKADIAGEKSVTVAPKTAQEKKQSPVNWSVNWIFAIVGRIIVMAIALALFGETIKRAGSVFDRRWPDALWKGAAFAVLVPFGILTLMLTIIGLPAAVLVALFYALVLMTAWVIPGYWLGRLLLPKVSPYAQGILAAVVISVVASVPMFGWLVRLVLAVLGTGALLDMWRRGR